jgi:hypothetical protein
MPLLHRKAASTAPSAALIGHVHPVFQALNQAAVGPGAGPNHHVDIKKSASAHREMVAILLN